MPSWRCTAFCAPPARTVPLGHSTRTACATACACYRQGMRLLPPGRCNCDVCPHRGRGVPHCLGLQPLHLAVGVRPLRDVLGLLRRAGHLLAAVRDRQRLPRASRHVGRHLPAVRHGRRAVLPALQRPRCVPLRPELLPVRRRYLRLLQLSARALAFAGPLPLIENYAGEPLVAIQATKRYRRSPEWRQEARADGTSRSARPSRELRSVSPRAEPGRGAPRLSGATGEVGEGEHRRGGAGAPRVGRHVDKRSPTLGTAVSS